MASELRTEGTTLTAERCRAFARATDDHNPAYAPGDLAPPMVVVLASVPRAVQLVLADERMGGEPPELTQVLHLEEDIRWRRTPRVGDRLRVELRHCARETTPSGETVVVATLVRAADDVVAETRSRVLVREGRSHGLPRGISPLPAGQGTDLSATWSVAADQSEQYAAASDDDNPIHIDDAAARAAGFSGRVLHGLCTMAFVQRVVVDGLLGGDPRRLRRLRVAFTRPVYMGDCLTLVGSRCDGGAVVEVRNQRGRIVLHNGLALVDGA